VGQETIHGSEKMSTGGSNRMSVKERREIASAAASAFAGDELSNRSRRISSPNLAYWHSTSMQATKQRARLARAAQCHVRKIKHFHQKFQLLILSEIHYDPSI
jgi:hypothetical protein